MRRRHEKDLPSHDGRRPDVSGNAGVGAAFAGSAIAKAERILKNFQDGKAEDIVKELDARMSKELTEENVKAAWAGVMAHAGAFKGISERREGLIKDRQAVELFLNFEKETILQRIGEGRIAGLVFRPTSSSVLPVEK
jgi:Protein of unknown function (DUF3887)